MGGGGGVLERHKRKLNLLMFSKLLCLIEVAHILLVIGEGGTLLWYMPPTGLIFKSS